MHYQEIKQRLSKAERCVQNGELTEAHSIIINTDGMCAADMDANMSRDSLKKLQAWNRKRLKTEAAGDTDNGPE